MSGSDSIAEPEIYDLMYGDFRADIGFHLAEARAAGGPPLAWSAWRN